MMKRGKERKPNIGSSKSKDNNSMSGLISKTLGSTGESKSKTSRLAPGLYLLHTTKKRILTAVGQGIKQRRGVYYVRPSKEFGFQCLAKDITIVDFRPAPQYRQLHIRNAINIPAKYLSFPPADSGSPIDEDSDELDREYRDLTPQEKTENLNMLSVVNDFINYNSLIKSTDVHRLVVCDEFDDYRRSTPLALIVHLLLSVYSEEIRERKLEIYVLRWGFERIKHYWNLDERILVSTDAYRHSDEYLLTETTDDDVHSHVLPYLYVSSSIGATNLKLLKETGITMIINLTEKQIDYPEGPFEILFIPMEDSGQQKIKDILVQVTQVIDDVKKRNGRVLVHCTRGQSRSVVACIGYLMLSRGWPLLRSFLHVRKSRPWLGPNRSFLIQLMVLEENLDFIYSTIPFPLHSYCLLESRDEPFNENLLYVGVHDFATVVFEHIEAGSYDKLLTLFKNDIWLKYSRKEDDLDNSIVLALMLIEQTDLQLDSNKQLLLLRILVDDVTVNWDNSCGEYPLHLAVQQGNCLFVELFLHAGARVDNTSISVGGRNAVHRGVMSYSLLNNHIGLKILTLLLNFAHLQKVIVPDVYFNQTPIDYAEFEGKFELVDSLRARQVVELFIGENENDHKPVLLPAVDNLSPFCIVVRDTIRTCLSSMIFGVCFKEELNCSVKEGYLSRASFTKITDGLAKINPNLSLEQIESCEAKLELYTSAVIAADKPEVSSREIFQFLYELTTAQVAKFLPKIEEFFLEAHGLDPAPLTLSRLKVLVNRVFEHFPEEKLESVKGYFSMFTVSQLQEVFYNTRQFLLRFMKISREMYRSLQPVGVNAV